MRILLQRVTKAKFISLEKTVAINEGLVVFVGFQVQDKELILSKMVNKFFNIRYFRDTDNKTKYTIEEKKAEVLIISQFTLFADVKKGRNPSWHRAETSASAEKLYDLFCKKMQDHYYRIKTGFFGVYATVDLVNDGPFTLLLDSQELFPNFAN